MITAIKQAGHGVTGFDDEIANFKKQKADEASAARQMAALQLACGIDLKAAFRANGLEKGRLKTRIERRLERERVKGLTRHWSYDLNRHIALKQALDRLSAGSRK